MNIIRKNLSDLQRPERNVRIHNSKQLCEFKRSLKMFGQIRPIIAFMIWAVMILIPWTPLLRS